MKERVIQLAQTVKDIQAKPKSGTDFRTGKLERYSYGFYFFGQLIYYAIVMGFLQLYMTESGMDGHHHHHVCHGFGHHAANKLQGKGTVLCG